MFETLALTGAVVSDVFQHQWQLLRPKSCDVCFFLNNNLVNNIFSPAQDAFHVVAPESAATSSFVVREHWG